MNIDGGSAAAPPGGVPTLALWAGADPPVGEIVGALNVTLAGQEHIESATSAEAFFEMYHFFVITSYSIHYTKLYEIIPPPWKWR